MLFSLLPSFLLLGSAYSAAVEQRATVCNGNAALCSRSWSNITHIGTHDSAFVGVLPTENQVDSVNSQLNAGIRMLQAQTHVKNGALEMCHTSCSELDAGSLVNYLTTIKTWMDANPNDVLTLLLTNGDYVSVSLFGTAFSTVGLDKYTYTAPSGIAMGSWPTLQTLINAGTRLIVFLDYDADQSVVPYIHPEFNYFFETAYDVTDENFSSCALDRPPNSNGNGLMMIVNHFLDYSLFGILIPDVVEDFRTNAATGAGSVGAQANLCYSTWGRNPNFILVDNFNLGDVFTAQNTLNHL